MLCSTRKVNKVCAELGKGKSGYPQMGNMKEIDLYRLYIKSFLQADQKMKFHGLDSTMRTGGQLVEELGGGEGGYFFSYG